MRFFLLVFCFLSGCATQDEGRCLKWKTTETERQECTRQPYRYCVVVPVTTTHCIEREQEES